MQTISSVIRQLGRIGLAIFLASYVWFNGGSIGEVGKFAYAMSLALVLWSIFAVASTSVQRGFSKRLFHNIVPSIIIFTQADSKAYQKITAGLNSSYLTIANIALTAIASVFVNVLSSYLYAYLIRKA